MPEKIPQPRDGESAEQAEARLKALNSKFRRVSGRFGGRAPMTRDGSASRGGFRLSLAEWAIAGGVVLFLLVVGSMAL